MAGWWLVVARNGFGWLVVAFSLLFIACNALMAVNGCLITFKDMFCQLVFLTKRENAPACNYTSMTFHVRRLFHRYWACLRQYEHMQGSKGTSTIISGDLLGHGSGGTGGGRDDT